ncbi:MAG TPA: tyrosinase family protein [Xanthobacteraceae bacterium]|nr:tyrosinase family protein [Xanthobacteraceae bacterium]
MPALYVRESIALQIRYKSPLIEAFRRGVDAMMRLPTWDRRNWWFQAYMYGVAARQIPPEMQTAAAAHFNKSAQRNFFFLAWNRMHLYFLERILRAASGDSRFVLPYWAFEDEAQSRVPAVFLPDPAELAPGADPYARRNALARALRHPQIDRGLAGLRSDLPARCAAVLQLASFATRDKDDPGQAFGGIVTQNPAEGGGIGGLEAIHNDVHDTLGLFGGDLGSVLTAARDPLFWVIHANLDRLWSKWIDPARGRDLPTLDPYWMNTAFTFVDEEGREVRMSGAHIVDAQYLLRYRYEDEPPRPAPLAFAQTVPRRMPSRTAKLVARLGAMQLGARDNRMAFAAVVPLTMAEVQSNTFRLVLRDVSARDRTSPYDVLLGAGVALPVTVGTLALYAGGRAERSASAGPVTASFDATGAVRQLARAVGASLAGLGVIVLRRGLADASGQELVSADPDPPTIGAIELAMG